MTEIDALAPGTAGRWTHENTAVEFSEHLAPGEVVLDRQDGSLSIRHRLSSTDIGEALVHRLTDMNLSQREFELALVGLVRSTVTDPVEAWTTYYRNSLDDLLSGSADFAPVHERAEALVRGSVLDLGSCFGFFPLRLAMAGIEVTATDLSKGTMRLLGTVAPHLGATIDVLTADAAGIPVADGDADTVTALHLLEHVEDALGDRILAEAIRIARERVVVAVPFETHATACHGHIRTFDAEALRVMGSRTGLLFEVETFHGGWLVLDTSRVVAPR